MASTTQLNVPAANPINIRYPMQYSPNGSFATNNTTIDAITDDLKILLKTNWGERVIQYDFGANLRGLLFEPMTDIKSQISDQINSAIEKWMPFVNVTSLLIYLNEDDPTVDENGARIRIVFAVANTGLAGDLTLDV